MARPSPELIAKWYAKLAAQGFDDIELPDGSLKDEYTKLHKPLSNAEYFRCAAQHYWDVEGWINATSRRVWYFHAEGYRIREIAKKIGLSKSTIGRIIMRERARMLARQKDNSMKLADIKKMQYVGTRRLCTVIVDADERLVAICATVPMSKEYVARHPNTFLREIAVIEDLDQTN